jgi:hypothetical protein
VDYGEGGEVRGKNPEARGRGREEEEKRREEEEKKFAGGTPAVPFLKLAAEFAGGPEGGEE